MAKNKDPWPADVCIALEELAVKREDAQTTRKSKFDEYKNLESEVADAVADKDEELATRKKAEAFDVKAEIDRLAYNISWFADRTQAIIKEAAGARKDPALFDTIDTGTKPPPPKPRDQQMNLGDTADVKTVGKPGKKPAAPADPELADGEQQHLKAAIGELGLSDKLLTKMIDAGYQTVGQVEKGDDGGFEGVELTTKEFNEVRKQLRKFLKDHHKAMHAAETGA